MQELFRAPNDASLGATTLLPWESPPSLPPSICAGAVDSYNVSWATTASDACLQWSTDSSWGALRGCTSLEAACAATWARNNCLGTCCKYAAVSNFEPLGGSMPVCTPFYLDEGGGMSFSYLENCVMERNQIRRGDQLQYIAHKWGAGAAEHAADWTLLQALRSHPMRSMDPSTPLHFTGILPILSFFTDKQCRYKWQPQDSAGTYSHTDRMWRAAAELNRRIAALPQDSKRVYVVPASWYYPESLLGSQMVKLVQSVKGQRHVVMANQDHAWSYGMQHVTIPYLPTIQLDMASHDDSICDASRREYSIFFAGTMLRHTGEGSERAGVLAQMAQERQSKGIGVLWWPQGRHPHGPYRL